MLFNILLILSMIILSQCARDFKYKRANDTRSQNSTSENDDILKNEITKYLKECRSENSQEQTSTSSNLLKKLHNSNNTKSTEESSEEEDGGNRKADWYRNNRSNSNKSENSNSRIDGSRNYALYEQNNGNGYTRYQRNNHKNNRCTYKFGIQNNSDGFRNHDGYNYESSYDRRASQKQSAGNGDFMINGGYRPTGYETPGYIRLKRSEEEIECISQCVFGYLDLLDENRVPSESTFIKWLQDHLSTSSKKMKTIRETRRCFSRLSSTDMEDGCEYSKSLANCLHLEMK